MSERTDASRESPGSRVDCSRSSTNDSAGSTYISAPPSPDAGAGTPTDDDEMWVGGRNGRELCDRRWADGCAGTMAMGYGDAHICGLGLTHSGSCVCDGCGAENPPAPVSPPSGSAAEGRAGAFGKDREVAAAPCASANQRRGQGTRDAEGAPDVRDATDGCSYYGWAWCAEHGAFHIPRPVPPTARREGGEPLHAAASLVKAYQGIVDELRAHVADLKSRLAGEAPDDARDAARYRFLRDNRLQLRAIDGNASFCGAVSAEHFDSYVDAVIDDPEYARTPTPESE